MRHVIFRKTAFEDRFIFHDVNSTKRKIVIFLECVDGAGDCATRLGLEQHQVESSKVKLIGK